MSTNTFKVQIIIYTLKTNIFHSAVFVFSKLNLIAVAKNCRVHFCKDKNKKEDKNTKFLKRCLLLDF